MGEKSIIKDILNYDFCGIINDKNLKFDMAAPFYTQIHAKKSF